MKLTWFGRTTFRLHIGGEIAVIDAEAAPAEIDGKELVSGADHVVGLGGGERLADASGWRGRARQRLLDADGAVRPLRFWSLGPDSLLIDADEDMPLLLLAGAVPELGRWAEKAVILLAGADLAERGLTLLAAFAPRLIALAGSEAEIDGAIAALREKLDGTALLALEPGLAVEV